MKRIHALGVIALAIVCALPANLAAQTPAEGKPIPFDLAIHQHELSDIVLSPDGRLVAYSVHLPPAKVSSGGAYYLPNGVPASIANRTLFITEVATGKQWQVGPDDGNSWRPSFSKDGAQIAFYCDKEGAAHVWVYEIKSRKSRQIANAIVKPQLWQGDEPQWSADRKEIFVPLALPKPALQQKEETKNKEPKLTVTVRRSGDELPKDNKKDSNVTPTPATPPLWLEFHTELAALDVKTGKVRTVVPSASTPTPNVLEVSPSGKWVVYVSVVRQKSPREFSLIQDLSVAPAAGGPVKVIATDLPVRMGALRGAYSMHPTRDQIFWVNGGKLYTVDLTTGSVTPKQLIPTYDVSLAPISFTHDGNALVTAIRPSGDQPNAQFKMSVAPLNGGAVKPIEFPAGMGFSGFLRQGDTLWQPHPETVVMSGRENSTGNNVVVKLDLKSNSSQVLWKGAKSPSIIGVSEDGTLVGIYADSSTPGDLYKVSADFSKKERLTNLNPRLEGVTFGPVETFTTEVPRYDGGKEVTSAIVLPPGAKRGDKLPTVVVVYPRSMGMPGEAVNGFGGGDAAGVPASVYTTNGYAVLFTQAPMRKVGEPGNIISELLAVIEPQVRHAIELGYTDETRIAVTGHSFGGYSAAALLSATNLFKAGIANAGIYDLAFIDYLMGADGGYFSEPGKTQAYWNMRGNLWEDQKSYIDASPFFRADKINAPLLIIHGAADVICSVEDARLMFNALRRLGKTVQLAEYADEGHFYSGWSLTNRSDVASRALEFLNKRMAAPKTATR